MVKKIGDGNDNVIFGSVYQDQLYGGGGNDILVSGWDNDWLDGGTGADTMAGGNHNDTYVVDNKGDKVLEHDNEGYDTVLASIDYTLPEFVEKLQLTGFGNTTGTGNGLDNKIFGNDGNNVLYGMAGDDELHGGAGNDVLVGGADWDIMFGDTGDDTFLVEGSDHVVEYADGGIDTVVTSDEHYGLTSNVENLILIGNGNSRGYGNELNNRIYGNTGDNEIDGGAGADTMQGGGGNDEYSVDQTGDVVVEKADEGIDVVYSMANEYTLGANVEYLQLHGSSNSSGSGNSLDNRIWGNSGNNTLYGFGGEDILDGGKGADIMYGGAHNDVYKVDDAGDVVVEYGLEGTDSVEVQGDLGYSIANSDNVEWLFLNNQGYGVYATGNGLENIIRGSLADNVIDGGAGADFMAGLEGNDTYFVDNIGDIITEYANQGHDVVFSTVDFTLNGGIEALSLATGNAVYGTGNYLSNQLFGNAGHNVLNGRANADELNGLGGDDTFEFYAGEANGDRVYEFDADGDGDVLVFSGYGTAQQGATLVWLSGDSWQITSANGSIQEVIHIDGAPNIDANDYMFV
jgi:Ca2+-binding RTX toxin-like protein